MRKLFFNLAFCLVSFSALAQTCPTRPTGDSSNACASTAFVQNDIIAISSTTAVKLPVIVATTTNITLSGTQTIDGVAVVSGNRVLTKDQSTASQNGIWVVASGAWTRPTDWATGNVVQGTQVRVTQGTTNANTVFYVSTSGTITVGSTSVSLDKKITAGGLTVNLTPVYDLAANVLGVGAIMPLDAASHTVAANKQFDHFRLSQTDGSDNLFTIGANAVVNGYSAFLTSNSGSDATSNLYAGNFGATNMGPGTVKAIHSTAVAGVGSTGVTVAMTGEVNTVAGSNTGSAAFQATVLGTDDTASMLTPSTAGARVLYGYGTVVSPVAYKYATFQAWMATASDTNARALQVLNNSGTELGGIDKSGNFFGPAIELRGSSSGILNVKSPAAAGSNTITLPAGTTDFSSTGGSGQVVKQLSSGGAFTVATIAASEIAAGGANTVMVSNSGPPSFSDTVTVGTSVTSPSIIGSTNLIASSAANGVTITQSTIARNNAAGSLTFAAGTNAGNTFAIQTGGSSRFAISDTNVNIIPSTASTSKSTGSLTNSGGFGNAGAIFTDTLSVITMDNAATTSAVCYNTGTGLLTYNATVGTCTVSDGRLKNIDGPIPSALDKLMQVHGVYFHWKDKVQGDARQIGAIAQEVEKVFPELVSTDSSGTKSTSMTGAFGPVIEAMRELKADNDNLRACIDSWKCRLFGINK